MCRRPAETAAAGRPVALAVRSVAAAALLLALAVAPVAAQSPAEPFALRPEVQSRLASLQSDWLDWLTAVQGGDGQRADRAAEQLRERVGDCGFERLPELSVAAAARAVEFARSGSREEAGRSLELAELLDPGRPETAFARSTVARTGGAWARAGGWYLRGLARTLTMPLVRYVLAANLAMWALNALALTALAFIGVQMATRGQLLYRDLSQALSRSLPGPLAHLLTLAILSWPVLLPAGLLWVTFFWSLLLWGYGNRGEKIAMIALWIILGGLPFVVSAQARRMDLALSRPVRAMQDVAAGRLSGQLLSDLQVLAELLPESTAVKHLLADLHLRLRQWDESQALYREVLEREPTATAALSDLGIALFYEGDLDGAIQVLDDAVSRPEASAEAYFNLGRAYAEQLRFDKQTPMTQRASQLADDRVRQWLRADVSDQVISVAGGFQRGPEIRRQLATVWRAGQGDPSLIAPWRRMLSLPLALVFVLPAIALHLLKRRLRNRSLRIEGVWADGGLETARRALLPGIAETEDGQPLRGLAGLFAVMALLTLGVPSLGYPLPLGYDPGVAPLPWLAASGLVVFFALRLRRAWLRPRKA